jgi:hypothetical protein
MNPANLYHYNARVVSVYDADTLTVDIDLGLGIWRLGIVRAKEDVAPKKDAPRSTLSASKFDPANHIKIAANSVEELRKQDVYRVFDEAPHGHQAWESLTDYMRENRPDLMGEVYDVRDEIGVPKNEDAERAKKKADASHAKPAVEQARLAPFTGSFTMTQQARLRI